MKDPHSPTPLNHDTIIAFMTDIFERRGADSYLGEVVTMSQHMLQAAAQAESHTADDELIGAALLHDIGHYTSEFPADMIGEAQDNYHEEAGARLLETFFPARVISCIRYHVPAKRYLCATDQRYYGQLSEASKQTLRLQGGFMSADEVSHFAALPYVEDIVQVRRWDDLAKDPEKTTPSFAHYRPVLERLVQAQAEEQRNDP